MVVGVDAVVADVWAGEGNDLPGVRGIGYHLLISGEDRVEYHFPGGHPAGRFGTDRLTLEHLSVDQHQLRSNRTAPHGHLRASPSTTTGTPPFRVCRPRPRRLQPS